MISKAEIIMLLVLSRLVGGITTMATTYDMERFLAVVTSFVIIFLLYIPLILYSRNHHQESITESLFKKHKLMAGGLAVITIALIFLSNIVSLFGISTYLKATLADKSTLLLIIVLILFTVLFAVYKGLETIAHVSLFVAAGFFAVIIAICIAEVPDVNVNFLYMGLYEHADTFWSSVLKELALNMEFIILPFLVPFIKENKGKTDSGKAPPLQKSNKMLPVIGISLGACCITTLLLLFFYCSVFGAFLNDVKYPLNLLGTLSNIGIVKQLDGFLGTFIFAAAILKIALFTWLILPISKPFTTQKWSNIITSTVIILSGSVVFLITTFINV